MLLAPLVLAACTSSGPPPALRPRVEATAAPLYGFWGLNGFVSPAGLAQVKRELGLTVFHTATMSPDYAVHQLLPMVQAAGLHVTLRLTGDHHHYTTPSGDFSLSAWQATLSRWEGAELAPFIADGTLAGHMLLDDIENFEGTDPSAADLDAMAQASKALWPGLMTFVRQQATDMPAPKGGTYLHVDAVVNQYKSWEGEVQGYAARQAAAATALDLAVINGMNIADGGDGSSGQPGWRPGKFAMSADEIRRYGAALASVPECGMFLNWEYDAQEAWSDGTVGSTYFDQPALRAALVSVGEQVHRHPPVPLRRP